MITIEVVGVSGIAEEEFSFEITQNLANLYEAKIEDIMMIASDAMVMHNGTEQTSWHSIIKVIAPKKYEAMQKNVAKFLLNIASEFSLHVHVIFTYFEESNIYHKINKEYPLFYVREDNDREVDEEDDESEEEIYHGNIFEGIDEKMKHHQVCECEGDCGCGEECDCGDDCDCGHHHDE